MAHLDLCIKRQQDNSLKFAVYRKPSNTGRLMDYNSYAPASHKINVVNSLVNRALKICSENEIEN